MSSVHSVGREVGLLGEFALGRGERVLAGDVEQPGGQLPVARARPGAGTA